MYNFFFIIDLVLNVRFMIWFSFIIVGSQDEGRFIIKAQVFRIGMATTLYIEIHDKKDRLKSAFDDIMKLYNSNDVKGMTLKKTNKAFRSVLMKLPPAS